MLCEGCRLIAPISAVRQSETGKRKQETDGGRENDTEKADFSLPIARDSSNHSSQESTEVSFEMTE